MYEWVQELFSLFFFFSHLFHKKMCTLHIEYDIMPNVTYCIMVERTWKCYRCDLTFKKGDIAYVHSDISGHPLTQIKS